jgi:hypothetical protein
MLAFCTEQLQTDHTMACRCCYSSIQHACFACLMLSLLLSKVLVGGGTASRAAEGCDPPGPELCIEI